ncbi:MAG: HIT family protein [Nitriliruptoraceae bacterium]|jgi:diadenosine tetraphosphate (Ap4A) HIT family hydrolase
MPSLFTRIIAGELPGRFVWRDDVVVAFLTIEPIRPGHVLVVPRAEVDHWVDLEPATWARVAEVARHVGLAVRDAMGGARVGQMIAGFEVPHVHVHVFPAEDLGDLSFDRVDRSPDPADLDDAADRIRAALRAMGQGLNVPD